MLSEVQSDNSGTPGPPPLGRLLVERGFLTEEQLQTGLAEHGRTGLPLGQVLIGMGFVNTAIIAQALATQQGGLVKTEYGFSTGFATEPTAPQLRTAEAEPAPAALPAEPAPMPAAEIIPLHQEAPQVEAPTHAWQAPPEVVLPAPAAPQPVPVEEVQPAPVAELQPMPVPVAAEADLAMAAARIEELQAKLREQQLRTEASEAKLAERPPAEIQLPEPEPMLPDGHEAAEPDLMIAAARLEELRAELREQQHRTEASEAKLAELAADAAAARDCLNSAVHRVDSMKQEIAAALQAELELRNENERLAAAVAEPTPTHELQVVRMEIASMRNELATVMDALRAVHARLGEHAATTPAPPAPDVPAPAGAELRLTSS